MTIIDLHSNRLTREERELLLCFRTMDQRRRAETLDLARDDAAMHPIEQRSAVPKLRLVASHLGIKVGGWV